MDLSFIFSFSFSFISLSVALRWCHARHAIFTWLFTPIIIDFPSAPWYSSLNRYSSFWAGGEFSIFGERGVRLFPFALYGVRHAITCLLRCCLDMKERYEKRAPPWRREHIYSSSSSFRQVASSIIITLFSFPTAQRAQELAPETVLAVEAHVIAACMAWEDSCQGSRRYCCHCRHSVIRRHTGRRCIIIIILSRMLTCLSWYEGELRRSHSSFWRFWCAAVMFLFLYVIFFLHYACRQPLCFSMPLPPLFSFHAFIYARRVMRESTLLVKKAGAQQRDEPRWVRDDMKLRERRDTLYSSYEDTTPGIYIASSLPRHYHATRTTTWLLLCQKLFYYLCLPRWEREKRGTWEMPARFSVHERVRARDAVFRRIFLWRWRTIRYFSSRLLHRLSAFSFSWPHIIFMLLFDIHFSSVLSGSYYWIIEFFIYTCLPCPPLYIAHMICLYYYFLFLLISNTSFFSPHFIFPPYHTWDISWYEFSVAGLFCLPSSSSKHMPYFSKMRHSVLWDNILQKKRERESSCLKARAWMVKSQCAERGVCVRVITFPSFLHAHYYFCPPSLFSLLIIVCLSLQRYKKKFFIYRYLSERLLEWRDMSCLFIIHSFSLMPCLPFSCLLLPELDDAFIVFSSHAMSEKRYSSENSRSQ